MVHEAHLMCERLEREIGEDLATMGKVARMPRPGAGSPRS